VSTIGGNLQQELKKTTNVEDMIVSMKNRSNSSLLEKIRSCSKLGSKYEMSEDPVKSLSNLDVKFMSLKRGELKTKANQF
jgi:hypothetical protein